MTSLAGGELLTACVARESRALEGGGACKGRKWQSTTAMGVGGWDGWGKA